MRKGIQFSIGMIVMIIISILLFSLALNFVFKWFGEAEEIKAEIGRQTQEQIEAALRAGNKLVAIPTTLKEAQTGNAVTFGVGVRNVVAQKEFSIQAQFSSAYAPDGRHIPVDQEYVQTNWLGQFATSPAFTLQRNEQKIQPVVIRPDFTVAPGVSTPKGEYVFNICVYDSPAPTAPCTVEQYQEDSGAFFTERVYQVTVRVL